MPIMAAEVLPKAEWVDQLLLNQSDKQFEG
jgi:hypothetical protein